MLLTILLIAHLIGDFVLQGERLAAKKRRSAAALFLHAGLYALAIAVPGFLLVLPAAFWPAFLAVALSHLLIDWIKGLLAARLPARMGLPLYLADQALHLAVIILAVPLFSLEIAPAALYTRLLSWPPAGALARMILTALLLSVPCAVFVKELFVFLQMPPAPEEKQNPRVGAMIGILERWIVAVLLLMNQPAAIGLVVAAKSIARFKQLEDQHFAEKYLVGTLCSVLLALLLTILVRDL